MDQTTSEQHDTAAQKEKSAGSLVGIIVIVLVLILGGLYFWGMRLQKELAPDTNAIGATR